MDRENAGQFSQKKEKKEIFIYFKTKKDRSQPVPTIITIKPSESMFRKVFLLSISFIFYFFSILILPSTAITESLLPMGSSQEEQLSKVIF